MTSPRLIGDDPRSCLILVEMDRFGTMARLSLHIPYLFALGTSGVSHEGRSGQGLIDYGIDMYHPTCAFVVFTGEHRGHVTLLSPANR